ncbi:MAG TPA: MFS transporter [Candidatus Limnocylindrales bacterium]|nr:MFS transporter [Candidatus Limnocylindrales bacterium]
MNAATHPAGSAQSEQTLNVLRNRRFLALWVAQVVTQVGGNMVLYGLTVQVFGLTRSSTSVSLLILSFLVPAVIFGAVAGVYVDRIDRRLILVATNVLRAAFFLAILFVINDIGLILLLTALISTLTTFFGPAEAAMIPVVVPRKQLLAANSLHVLTLQASFFLGFALLGPLVVNLAGQQVLLIAVGASYLVGAALCWFLPKYNPSRQDVQPDGGHALGEAAEALGDAGTAVASTFSQLLDGLRYIRQNRTVFWPLTYLAVTASLIGVLGVLGPGFATQVLGLSEKDFVVVVLPLGVGLVMGIFALNIYGKYFSRRRGIEAGLVGLGVTLLALSVAQGFTTRFSLGPLISLLAVVIVVAFFAGVAYAFVAVPAQTQLQEELPANIRGRVFGVLNMLVSVASFVPIIVVGPIADAVGTSLVIQGSSVVVLLVAAGSILRGHSTADDTGGGGLVDVADPVSITTSRSLTSPQTVDYMREDHDHGGAEKASPVVPGQPGPAREDADRS